MMRRKFNLVVVLLTVMWVTACSNVQSLLPRYSDNRIHTVHLITTDNVNQSTPVAVDIVYVFEEDLVPQLSTYTARKWFNEKYLLLRQNPTTLAIFNYELVPIAQAAFTPSKQKDKFPRAHQKAHKVLIYANYLVESTDYTLDISPYIRPTINLGEIEITITDRGSRW